MNQEPAPKLLIEEEDPHGRRPVIRLIAAVIVAFSFATFLGLSVVSSVVPPEPEIARQARIASAVIFALSSFWGLWLIRELRREIARKKGPGRAR